MITVEGLDRIRRELNQFEFKGKNIEARFLDLVGKTAVQVMKQAVPVDTGRLSNSFSYKVNGSEVTIFTDDYDKLIMMDRGTAPHTIRPDKKNVLRFEIGGQEIFTSQVYHPGTQAMNFLNDIINFIGSAIQSSLEQALKENHPHMEELPGVSGGRGSKFRATGIVTGGLKGGKRATGSRITKVGMGRKTLRVRRPYLRFRAGKSIISDNKVKLE